MLQLQNNQRLSLEEVNRLIAPQEGPVSVLPTAADVVIVGAGPIGLTAANLLGSMGIRTVLVEQNAATADLPRALAVDDEYLRLLATLGLLDAVVSHRSPPFGIYFFSPNGRPLIKVNPFRTPNGFSNRNGVMQPVLEKILLAGTQRFSSLGVNYRSKLARIKQTEAGFELTITNGGHEHTIVTRYLLGCDGSRSFVRRELQIPFDGDRIEEPHLVLDLADFPDDAPYSRFFCNPRRPFNSIPTPYGGRRIEFMLMPGDDPQTITGEASIRELIDRFTPYRGAKVNAIRHVVYSYSARIARHMRHGRAFLLGDAAHVMPPFGAAAMNTGARDAANLCWKLGMVLRGEAGDSLLESYDTERREHAENIIRYSVRVGRVANIQSVALAWLRDVIIRTACLFPGIRRYFEQMRYMPKPFLRRGFVAHSEDGGAGIGRTFPRLRLVAQDGKETNFDAVAGAGFALVGIDVADGDLEEIRNHPLLTRLRPKVLSLASAAAAMPGAALRMLPDDVLRLDKSASGTIVLIRPDRYVATAGSKQAIRSRLDQLGSSLGKTAPAMSWGAE
jgi:3-(3-hydroxy-phenyl)propionate hydroxylase